MTDGGRDQLGRNGTPNATRSAYQGDLLIRQTPW